MNPLSIEVGVVPTQDNRVKKWQTMNFASTATSASSMRGSAVSSAYLVQGINYLREVIDAAKERMMFLQVAAEKTLGQGNKDMIWQKRKKYLGRSSWEASAAEYDPSGTSEIPSTQINTNDGVQFTPVNENYQVALTNDNIRTNALDAVGYARDELSYRYEDVVDTAISTALTGATAMSNTVWGMQTIFGNDKTNTANDLNAGDTLSSDMIVKMRRLLQSTKGYYWNSNVWTVSGVTKNPWVGDASEPIVLFIAPEQEESLFTSNTQFSNASEYGGNDVVLNGQIGRYAGVNIVQTTKIPTFVSGDNVTIQGASVAQDVTGSQCIMVKAKRSVGVVYGRTAEFKVYDWPTADQVRLKLSMAYQANAVHPDAIVRALVSDA